MVPPAAGQSEGSRQGVSPRQPIGGPGGAVALPKTPIRTLKMRTSEEGAWKAGRPRRREAQGSERPGGPVVGGLGGRGEGVPASRPGLAHGSNPTPGPPFHSPMMVRAAETMTTGSESALILPHDRPSRSSCGPQNSRLSERRRPALPQIYRAGGGASGNPAHRLGSRRSACARAGRGRG